MSPRAFLRCLALAAAACALGACGTLDTIRETIASIIQPGGPRTAIGTLRVVAEPQANLNSATALDIVFIYESKAADQLPKTGPEWFARKTELVNFLAEAVEVLSLQIPPATPVTTVKLPARYEFAVRVLAYTSYFPKDGQPAGNLTRFKQPLITLKPESVEYADR